MTAIAATAQTQPPRRHARTAMAANSTRMVAGTPYSTIPTLTLSEIAICGTFHRDVRLGTR